MAKLSKRAKTIRTKVDSTKEYSGLEASKIIKRTWQLQNL